MRYFFLIGLCAYFSIAHFDLCAQSKVIDSLQNRIKTATTDTAKINLMNKVNSILSRNEYRLAIQKTRETLSLAQQSEYVLGEMIAVRIMAMAFSELREKDSAFYYIGKAMELYPKVAAIDHYKYNEKANYSALGNIYQNFGLDKEALIACLRCLKLSEETKDTMRIASMLNGIGIIHKSEGDLVKAKEYWTRAVQMSSFTSNFRLQASTNTNLGIAYLDIKAYDTALMYLNKAHEISLQQEGKASKFVLYNSGQAYLGLHQYANAQNCFEQVLVIAKKDEDVIREVLALKGLSEVAAAMRKWALAIEWGNKAEKKLAAANDVSSKKKVYEVLFQAHQGARNFEKALDYHMLMMQYKDSIFSLERAKEVSKLETKYGVEKKDAENNLLKKEKDLQQLRIKQQMWVIVSALIIMGFVLLLSIFMYKGRQREKRINRVLASQKEELQHKNRLLEELNTVKNRLFSIISHDLRAPLNSLKSLLDLLNNKTLSNVQVFDLLPKLTKDVGYTSELLDGLLYWAKSQLDGIHLVPKNLNLHHIVAENMGLIHTIAEQKKIVLKTEIEEGIHICADEDMIRIIFRNLISNALKFTKANGEVTITAQCKAATVEIVVADTGVGMSQATVSQLFHGSITTRGTENEKGTGLGLMLVREFVEKNAGTISVESDVGKGSRFIITFPLSHTISANTTH